MKKNLRIEWRHMLVSSLIPKNCFLEIAVKTYAKAYINIFSMFEFKNKK